MDINNYIDFFKSLLGYNPYDYQVQTAKYLLEGKNVVLSVPTGAGKTNASIIPYLYALLNGEGTFPQKMIYSLPLRSLTNSIYSDLCALFDQKEVYEKYPELQSLVSIQSGEYSEDPYFEKQMVFSTIDQTLSNFLCFPLPLSKNQANINAGSIIGSYLVFDEFHLLDYKLSMSTSLGMLRVLKNLCRVCIMTATLTDDFISFLHDELGFEVVTLSDYPDDSKRIKSLKPSDGKKEKKTVTVVDGVIDSKRIVAEHVDKTIVICNRVETAQRIFIELSGMKNPSTDLLCIHSRFYDSDRKRIEQLIKTYFGKGSEKHNVILVATQVIEAGMDISCDKMHVEISPINSFLQRVGRCARFENEYGNVFVYDVLNVEEKDKIADLDLGQSQDDSTEIKKLNSKYLPYDKELCCNSFQEIKKIDSLNERTNEFLVNKVLGDEEKKMISTIKSKLYNQEEIKKSWQECDKKYYRKTIRDIQSISIAMVNLDEMQGEKIKPWKYETISVYRWSFIGWVKKLMEENVEDWIIAKAEQSENSQFDFEWEDGNSYYLRKLSFDELKNYYDVVFVDNRCFDYNEAGLMVKNNTNGKTSPFKIIDNVENEMFEFRKDSFYEHSKALIGCYEKKFKKFSIFAMDELNTFWGKKYDWDVIIKMTLCLHDYGKLNKSWQQIMLDYQRLKCGNPNYFEVLAHADYNERTDLSLAKQCKIKNKPPHAGIGAVQIYDILYDKFENEHLARAVSCSVLKHHNVETISNCDYRITDKCFSEVKHLLVSECGVNCSFSQSGKSEKLTDLIPTIDKEWILYLFIVRILRLCDQKSTENFEKYYQK